MGALKEASVTDGEKSQFPSDRQVVRLGKAGRYRGRVLVLLFLCSVRGDGSGDYLGMRVARDDKLEGMSDDL